MTACPYNYHNIHVLIVNSDKKLIFLFVNFLRVNDDSSFNFKGFRSILDTMKSYAEENNQHVPDIEVDASKE